MKKIFSLFVALTAVFSLSAKTLYLQPNDDWKSNNARFAVYAFNDSENVWYDLAAVAEEEGIFSATVDDKYTKVIFCRMNPAITENRWNKDEDGDNKPVWNQTQDMTIEAEKDQCNITGWNSGVWAKHGEVPVVKYYLKNNWKGEKEWSWKEMTAREDGKYELLKVVFGGSGVNLNVAETDDGSKFFSSEEKAEGLKIQGDKIQALDTVNFVLELKTEEAIVTAELVGRPKAPEYRLENGYYLFGSPFDWKLENVKAAQKFVANGDKGEWVLKEVKLEVGDSIKVIEVAADTIKAWFGTEGGDKNYGIDEKHAGEKKDIYFNPTKQDKWNGYIWIGETIFLKDLKLVPGVWTTDEAVLAVHAWGKDAAGAWVQFKGEGDTLVAEINEKADSVIIARMDPKKDIEWAAIWNRTENLLIEDCGIFFVNYWDQYSWCEAKEPVIPANFYVTGDSAFLNDAGSEKGVWDPKAIESKNDTLVLNLKGGQIYRFKVLPEGDWGKPNKGFGELSDKKGLLPDSSYNVSFGLNKDGEVKIVYIPAKEDKAEIFKVIGDLALENLKLVPGVASADRAKFAAWIWEIDQPGAWTEFFAGAGDTLSVEIPAFADSIIFARFNPIVETPYWPSNPEDQNMWNNTDHKLIDHKGLTFTATSIFDGTWEVVTPEVPAKFYITGSASLVGGEGWKGNEIKSTEDSYTFEKLAAGKYQLKVVDGANWKGIDEMSEVAAGLYRDQDKNVCFILAEEGDVKVTYKKGEESTEFTLEGAFAAPEMKLIGSFAGAWTEETQPIDMEVAADKKSASKTLELDGDWYDFKVIRDGEWLGKKNEGDKNYTIHSEFNWVDALERDAEGVKAISLQPKGEGEYTFTYDFASGKLTVTFPKEPEPVLANGYYLIGVINGVASTWDYASLKAEHIFALNPSAEGAIEYALEVTLAENDEIQVVRCDNDAVGAWYPGGQGNNYKVEEDHAGKVTIYFRPNGDGGNDWWHKYFYVAVDEPSAVDNTEVSVKAVKTLRNGMLIIEKNGVRYTVTGQAIR